MIIFRPYITSWLRSYEDGSLLACDEREAEFARIIQTEGPYELTHDFKWPEEKYKYEQMCRALTWAAENGAKQKAVHVANTLKNLLHI